MYDSDDADGYEPSDNEYERLGDDELLLDAQVCGTGASVRLYEEILRRNLMPRVKAILEAAAKCDMSR